MKSLLILYYFHFNSFILFLHRIILMFSTYKFECPLIKSLIEKERDETFFLLNV